MRCDDCYFELILDNVLYYTYCSALDICIISMQSLH